MKTWYQLAQERARRKVACKKAALAVCDYVTEHAFAVGKTYGSFDNGDAVKILQNVGMWAEVCDTVCKAGDAFLEACQTVLEDNGFTDCHIDGIVLYWG